MNYITAEQAREMGAWNAEYFQGSEGWMVCGPFCYYAEGYKYRAIKQAQPEPQYRKIEGVDHDPRYELVKEYDEAAFLKRFETNLNRDKEEFFRVTEQVDPHAALRVEYAKQVKEGTTGFYLWEVLEGDTWKKRDSINNFYPVLKYRFTDISCYVSKDGKPAIRMLRTEAQALQSELGGTVGWSYESTDGRMFTGYATNSKIIGFGATSGVYTYRTKATIKLNGQMVTREQAAAEWEAKKETHDAYYKNRGSTVSAVIGCRHCLWVNFSECKSEYELRPKQPAWTGSRDDVIALLKEVGLL
jgi:hypothetical protein